MSDYSYTIINQLDDIREVNFNSVNYIIDTKYKLNETAFLLTRYDDAALTFSGITERIELNNVFDVTGSTSDVIEQTLGLFYVNTEAFDYWGIREENSEEVTDSSSGVTSQVALYLNNTLAKERSALANKNERLLCVAGDENYESGRSVRNFLSIKKNGALYIGGFISAVDEDGNTIEWDNYASMIPNYIEVNQPLLSAVRDEKGEKISIDFDRFFNQKDGKSLFDSLTIAGTTVGAHRHELNSAIAIVETLEGGEVNYLPDESASPEQILYYTESGVQHSYTVKQVIDGMMSGKTWGDFYAIIYKLLREGEVQYQPSSTSSYLKVKFDNQVLGNESKINLSFQNSTTGGVIGGGSSTQSYGLYDPGNEDSGGDT